MKNKRLFFLAFLGVAAIFLLIYHGALDNYFFQDNFYFLRLSRAENFLDFFKFFSPWHQQGFPAYRPLGTKVYFFFGQLFPAFAYALLRLLSFSQLPGEEYQLSLMPKTFFSSLRWYLIWLLGAPETIINYAQGGINFSVAKFTNDVGISAYFFGGLFLAEFIVLCLILINLGRKKKSRRQVALFLLLGLAAMIISLSLVIFMPYHRFAHYLDLSLFLFLVVLGLLVKREKELTLTLVFIFASLFLANAFFCVRIDEKLHWVPGRSKIAAKYQEFFKNEGVCNNRQGIYFIDTKSNSAKEVAIALSFA